jgi:hypothetical protein
MYTVWYDATIQTSLLNSSADDRWEVGIIPMAVIFGKFSSLLVVINFVEKFVATKCLQILLKVALNTIKQANNTVCMINYAICV